MPSEILSNLRGRAPFNQRRSREAREVCHTPLQDPNFFALLQRIDADYAAGARVDPCVCGGVFHSAPYPRKPRGGPRVWREVEHRRQSFCCNRCRQRRTPRSLLYLGRRVYLGAVVVLGSALRGTLSGRGLRELSAQLGVPRATLERWRAWWREGFVRTPFWQAHRGDFLPPLVVLPADLLARFTATDPGCQLRQALRFLAPLSTVTEGR